VGKGAGWRIDADPGVGGLDCGGSRGGETWDAERGSGGWVMSRWRWSCKITLKQHVVRSKNSYLFLGNVEKKIVT
jgi:hypothetical protein